MTGYPACALHGPPMFREPAIVFQKVNASPGYQCLERAGIASADHGNKFMPEFVRPANDHQ